MTEHTVTIEETVQTDETVVTCDYCGLGNEAGEMITYTPDSSDGELAMWSDDDDVDGIPSVHFHVSCIPKVTASQEQAEKITLASQYERRTGDKLLFVITAASMIMFVPAMGLLAWGYLESGIFRMALGGFLLLVWAIMSREEAKNTLREFST